jgi:hypothetical protein
MFYLYKWTLFWPVIKTPEGSTLLSGVVVGLNPWMPELNCWCIRASRSETFKYFCRYNKRVIDECQ